MVRIGLRSNEVSREVAFLGLLLFSLPGQDQRGKKEVQSESFCQIRARASFDRKQGNVPHFAIHKLQRRRRRVVKSVRRSVASIFGTGGGEENLAAPRVSLDSVLGVFLSIWGNGTWHSFMCLACQPGLYSYIEESNEASHCHPLPGVL